MSMVARPLVLASILSLLTLLTPLSANAQWSVPWRKAESAHFEVYSDFDERELRSYVDKLEDYDSILRRFDGADPAAPSGPKFKIYLVLGQMDVNAIFPGAPEQTAGLLVNNAQDVYFVDDRRTLMRQFQDVVFRDPIAGWFMKDEAINKMVNYNIRYDYADKTILETFGPKAPTWYVAGAASFFAGAQFDAHSVKLGSDDQLRARTVATSPDWIALSDLFTKKPFYMTAKQIDAYRAESWLLVHYMVSDDGRRQKLGQYLKAVVGGADSVGAWGQIVGGDFDSLTRDLKAYATGSNIGVTWRRAGWPSTTSLAVTPLPSSADHLMLDAQRLELDVDNAGQLSALRQIRTDAAPFPQDRLAQLVLARAELLYGDHDKGETILQNLIKADPNDVEPQLALALGRIAQGDQAPGQRKALYHSASLMLDDLAKQVPDDPRVLYFRAKGYSLDDAYPDDQTLASLFRAVEIDPLSFEIRRGLAEALAKRGRFDEAADVLQPVIGFRLGEITKRTIDELQDIEDLRGQKLALNK